MDPRDLDIAALRRALRSRLGSLGTPLQILAEDMLGEDDARIDWLAMEPSGRVALALLDGEGGGEALLARGLAQRAWVHARIGDWRKLAPHLQARSDLRPRLLLLAPDFSRIVRLAAREADAEGVHLARVHWVSAGGSFGVEVEPIQLPPAPVVEAAPESPPLASVFRSGLGERDFGANGGGQQGS